MSTFWLNEGDWLGPVTKPELGDLLAESGYTADGSFMMMLDEASPALVFLGPDLGCLFVESLAQIEGEHLYRYREVAA